MHDLVTVLRSHPLFRAAILVPSAITLIFSLFNLTAPPDPERLAGAFRLAVVNEDKGLTFPPINIASRMMQGMGARLPFTVVQIDTVDDARARLKAADVSAVLHFPPEFSKMVLGGGDVTYGLILSDSLPMAEAQIAAQMPMMLDTAMSAAVGQLRLATAKGQLPDMKMPVSGSVERLYPAANGAARIAPFVSVYTTWLAALAGGFLLFLVTRPHAGTRSAAMLRTVLPVAASAASSLTLTVLVAATAGLAGGFFGFWLSAWVLLLALTWAMTGMLAVFGPASLVVAIPLVFYQPVLGGAQMPAAAAPEWLARIGAAVPFDHVGAVYRGAILGGGSDLSLALVGAVAASGLALIWLGYAIRRGRA